jgi:hypothetical protein
MAFTTTLSRAGFEATYLKLTYFEINIRARTCSAHWSLYKDRKASKDGETALVEIVAKLRVSGDDFDTFFEGTDNERLIAKLYEAARAVSTSPATYRASHVVSDYGTDIFKKAADAIE